MMPVTIMQLAEYRIGREATTGSDYAEACLPIMGGCEHCGATIAAYNAYPSKSGYLRCRNCIDPDGWYTVEEANAAIFADEQKTRR